jgi:transcriptional regulator with XRE-family HTH domain
MTLGDELKRLREAAGLTQDVLAERIGITQGFVANLEANRKSIKTTGLLFKLCDALGVSCDHFRPFLTGEDEPVEPNPPAKPKGKKK